MYKRSCNILKEKSFFLFGARGTGKSSLLRAEFEKNCLLWVNLLDSRDYLKYSKSPAILGSEIRELLRSERSKANKIIVLDEIQKVPALLDEVHKLLETPELSEKILFALSGSSARKLKRGGANLLAGRALLNYLYPLTSIELQKDFNLSNVLNWGSLPAVHNESNDTVREEILFSYISAYLREEIKEEQIVRNLDPFNRFLEVAAQSSGNIVNYSNIGRDCGVSSQAISKYYQILEDTLIGHFLPPYHGSVRKQQGKSPKFYLFDLGVIRALNNSLGSPLVKGSYGYGVAFEHFFILEVIRLNSYLRKRFKLSYLITKDGAEIDLIIEREKDGVILIEIKSSSGPTIHDAKHLRSLMPSFFNSEAWVVSQIEVPREESGIRFLPWKKALNEIFYNS